MAFSPEEREKATQLYLNRAWRLRHLYTIQDKEGKLGPFNPNWAQEQIFTTARKFAQKTKRNVPLKGRQLGISTGIRIDHMDRALTAPDARPFRSALIDITLEKAREKMDWIRRAWENLDNPGILGRLPALIGRDIKMTNPLVVDRACHMEWANGSSLKAGTSFQGSTVDALHVSEYGEIAHDWPDRAHAILYKTLPAVPKGCDIWMEGTHQGGKGGEFYRLCQQGITNLGRPVEKLTELDWIFHFLPWWKQPEYFVDGDPGELKESTKEYFAELAGKHGIVCTVEQQLWWQGQKLNLGNQIYLQYPSTVDEAFNAPSAKAVYGDLMLDVRASGRVKEFSHMPGYPIYTGWDLGQSDSTVIWWFQIFGGEILVLDWYEMERKPTSHYANIVREKEQIYGPVAYHLLPHDSDRATQGSGKKYLDYLAECGIRNAVPVPKIGRVQMGIDMVRDVLPRCVFHSRCDIPRTSGSETKMSGIQCMESYHYKEERVGEVVRKEPVHDPSSHSCDGFRTFAEGLAHKVVDGMQLFGAAAFAPEVTGRESRWEKRRKEREYAPSMSIGGMGAMSG